MTILDHLVFDAAARKELADLLTDNLKAHKEAEAARHDERDAIKANARDLRGVTLAVERAGDREATTARLIRAWTRRALARASTPQPRSPVSI